MEHWYSRTELLLGAEKLEKLQKSHVLVVGLGGVGGWAAEMICRAGVGKMTIVDGDTVNPSNINRQLPATHSHVGKSKAHVLADRLRDINPDLELRVCQEFIREERTLELLNEDHYDYVVDAIDTLSPKLFLIYHTLKKGLPIISSMGAGGKMDPSKIQIVDISKTYNCRLARMMRKRLHPLGVREGLTVVFSPEEVPAGAIKLVEDEQNKRSTLGTISFLPPAFGCFLASHVIRQLVN